MSLSTIGLCMLLWAMQRSPQSLQPQSLQSQSAYPPIAAPKVTPEMTTIQPDRALQYTSYTRSDSTIYTLKIPVDSQFLVLPAMSQAVETLELMAQRQGAIAALNGGFFDPENQQSTAYVVLNGKVVADPRQNESLMHNPTLTPYLSKILNRTEFRQYQCGDRRQYAIALHSDAIPKDCQLVNALGGGPRLLPVLTAQQEGFVADTNGVIIRDALGSRQPNARTAIGITRDRCLLWVMVAQTGASASGMTLQALADFLKTVDVEQAMNLDGGSSSSFYYGGKTVYGKLDSSGQPMRRPIKSALLVKRQVDRK